MHDIDAFLFFCSIFLFFAFSVPIESVYTLGSVNIFFFPGFASMLSNRCSMLDWFYRVSSTEETI